jgi:hypothetical protein
MNALAGARIVARFVNFACRALTESLPRRDAATRSRGGTRSAEVSAAGPLLSSRISVD